MNLRDKRILLVEDSKDNQELISRMLSLAGAKVDCRDNGREGVEAAMAADYDAVVMDLQMPEMGGLEAVELLREKGYVRPVIALTAHAMRGEREKSMAAGFNEHLTKPIDRRILIETLLKQTGASTTH